VYILTTHPPCWLQIIFERMERYSVVNVLVCAVEKIKAGKIAGLCNNIIMGYLIGTCRLNSISSEMNVSVRAMPSIS